MKPETDAPPLSPDELVRIRRIRSLARFLDDAVEIPIIKYRIGFDGAIGLVPIVGELVTGALAFYIVKEAASFGMPRAMVFKMILKSSIDLLSGAVPIAGDAFDFVWKANRMNILALEKWLRDNGRLMNDIETYSEARNSIQTSSP